MAPFITAVYTSAASFLDRAAEPLPRIMTPRGGESLGGVLVGEGLAERWQGFRGSWC